MRPAADTNSPEHRTDNGPEPRDCTEQRPQRGRLRRKRGRPTERKIRSAHVKKIPSIKRNIIAAAKNTTSQKRRRLSLPLPLRKNGVINATDAELEGAQKFCEHFAIVSTGLVFIGLVIEVYVAIEHPSFDSSLERWGSVIADVLVAFGVLGELLPSMLVRRYNTEVKRRSDDRLSEAIRQAANANERAANAELELGKLQAQVAPRVLGKEQHDALQMVRGHFSKVYITSQQDSEAAMFAFQIRLALRAAGISVEAVDSPLGARWSGIYLEFPTTVNHVDNPLTQAFVKAGLYGGSGDFGHPMLPDMPTDAPLVMVGEKYMRFFEKPYIQQLDAAKSNPQKSDK